MIELIVAKSLNGVIGMPSGKLPWHLPAELKLFKSITEGNKLIMGRKTFELIGKPLPGRTTYILTSKETRQCEDMAIRPNETGTHALTINQHGAEKLIEKYRDSAYRKLFIAGGAQVYERFIDEVDIMHVTTVHCVIPSEPGCAYFDDPTDNPYKIDKWELIETKFFKCDEVNTHSFTYNKYKRI
ncbi:hypothetical protein RsoM2USA_194 [Ralstonia phage RsoM2USA]|nr:hypothetical protein RsoM2USA_194 [Ralstonia phage RsoM2USA]